MPDYWPVPEAPMQQLSATHLSTNTGTADFIDQVGQGNESHCRCRNGVLTRIHLHSLTSLHRRLLQPLKEKLKR